MDLDTLPRQRADRARARAAADGPGRAARRAGQLRGDPLADPARARRRRSPGCRRCVAGSWPPRCAPAPPPRYAAVAGPVEGTVLTVVAAAAAARRAARTATTCRRWSGAAARAARRGARPHPGAAAGAGPRGRGRRRWPGAVRAARRPGRGAHRGEHRPARADAALRPARRPTVARETGSRRVRLRGAVPARRREPRRSTGCGGRSTRLGDSLVVVGDGREPEGTWNVHVHVNDVGRGDRGRDRGRPPVPDHGHPVRRPAGAALRPGDGRAGRGGGRHRRRHGRPVRRRGRHACVPGNPSTGELLDAVRGTGAARVVVLPNDANTEAVASAAAREAHRHGIRVERGADPVAGAGAGRARGPRRRAAASRTT